MVTYYINYAKKKNSVVIESYRAIFPNIFPFSLSENFHCTFLFVLLDPINPIIGHNALLKQWNICAHIPHCVCTRAQVQELKVTIFPEGPF